MSTDPVSWTIERVIPRTGVSVWWGASTVGKSFCAFDAALAIANPGSNWLGFKVKHHGSVAYCLGEGLAGAGVRLRGRQVREQADRAAAIRCAGSVAAAGALADEFADTPYDASGVRVLTEAFSCHMGRDEKPMRSFARALAQLATIENLECVFIDALADFKGELSLASDSSAGRILKGLKFLSSELDCAVVAIAHPVSDGSKMAGSARFFQGADAVIEISPDEGSADGLKSATVTSRKSKEDEPFDPVSYFLEPVRWPEPETDEETGELTGGTVIVTSATVRLREDPKAAAPAERAAPVSLPELMAVPRKVKRTGIKPRVLAAVSAAEGPVAVPAPDGLDPRAVAVAGVLGVPCTRDCQRPAGSGCDGAMKPKAFLIGRTGRGEAVMAHSSRIMKAAMAGHLTEDQLDLLAVDEPAVA